MNAALLRVARRLGVFELNRRATRRSLRVLAYHGLWTLPGFAFGDKLFMSPEQFTARMGWLAKSSYPVVGLDEAVDMLDRDTLPDHAVVITIDDGWSSTYTHMLPVLEALSLPATLYVATLFVERQQPVGNVATRYIVEASPLGKLHCPELGLDDVDLHTPGARSRAVQIAQSTVQTTPLDAQPMLLRTLASSADVDVEPWWNGGQFHFMTATELADTDRRGVAIELHTHGHRMDREPGGLTGQLEANRSSLMRITGKASKHFCYPSGDHLPGDEPVLRTFGVKSATLVEEGLNAPGTNPFRIRRLLDGRTIDQDKFEAYMTGTSDWIVGIRNRMTGPRAG